MDSLLSSTKWSCIIMMKILPQTKYVLQLNPVMKFYVCCQQAFSPLSPGFIPHLLNKPRQVKAAETNLDSA